MKHLPRRTPRGVALILALVAVAAATILGVTVAATRDASTAASDAVTRNASARAAAAGGLDLVTVLVDDATLFAANDAGGDPIPLFEPVNIGAVTLRAEIRDLETGGPVTAVTRAFVVVTEATVGQVTQAARSVSQLTQADIVARADLDLSEFAVFATREHQGTRIRARAQEGVGSTIAAWQTAPSASLSEPLVIGTFDRLLADIVIDPLSTALGHTLLDQGPFADSNAALDDDIASGVTRIPHDIHVIPVVAPPKPAQQTAATADIFLAQLETGPSNLSVAADISMGPGENTAVRTLATEADQWRQIDIDASLKLDGASLRVEVPTLIVVRGELRLEDAAIEVDAGASLVIVVQGDITLEQSYIGARRAAGEGLAADGHAPYPVGGAGSVLIAAETTGDAFVSTEFRNGSVVKGRVYAPSRAIAVSSGAAIYGSVVGETIELRAASVFYDTALRTDRGWLNPRSGIYDATGDVRPEVRAIGALTDSAFADFAEASGIAPDLLLAPMMPNALASGAGGGSGEQHGGGKDGGGKDGGGKDGGGKDGGGKDGGGGQPEGTLTLVGTLRAIAPSCEANGHPDFASSAVGVAHYIGTVDHTLGPDGKPAYRGWTVGGKWQTLKQNSPFKDAAGNRIAPHLYRPELGDTAGVLQPNNKPSALSATSLAGWFADGPSTKLLKPYTMTFAPNGGGDYAAHVFVNASGNTHSPGLEGVVPYYTLEASGVFTYFDTNDAGYTPYMLVKADDDLWIFVNGQLVADISGIQNQEVEQHIDLTRLGLSKGQEYEIKVFYASRKDNASIMKIATNLVLSATSVAGKGPGETPLERLRSALRAVEQRHMDGEFDRDAARFGSRTPPVRRNFGAVSVDQGT